ncbi:hypothetical protein cyc_07029 [Cyclospora cayetanensis]|uniref:Uncharacterized protein n=1 Tax=Cyclospora cayetanensis TaxID=88456 RepID=A0A1D3DA81_9EIME|nr:hypothetical protein cyc_07029 [Cyclospora cayetanensis]
MPEHGKESVRETGRPYGNHFKIQRKQSLGKSRDSPRMDPLVSSTTACWAPCLLPDSARNRRMVMPENRSGSVPPSVGGPRVTSKVASLSSQRVSLPHDDDPLHHLDHCGEQFPTRVGKFLEPENPLSSSLSNFTDGATVHTPDTTEETARDSSRPPSSENCMRRRTARRHFSAPSEGTSLVAATAPTRACTPRIQQLTDWKASAAASQDTESTCVIIRDERYSWEHITGRRMHRPTEMSAHCSRRLYPIGRSPGEHRAGDTHGNPAVGIVHSVFSSFPASFRALFRRLYGGQQQSLVSPSRASQQQVSRQHHRSPHSLNSLSLIATGPNFLRGPANDFEHFVEEHEDSMMFRGYELDHPIFFILSEGDEAEEVMPLASRNPNERLLSLRQVAKRLEVSKGHYRELRQKMTAALESLLVSLKIKMLTGVAYV